MIFRHGIFRLRPEYWMYPAMRLFAFLLLVPSLLFAGGDPVVHTLKLPPAAGMTRADLKWIDGPERPDGVLVLCPGFNGDGSQLFSADWIKFAQRNHLLLVGLSFASNGEDTSPDTRRGYYYVEKGSGRLLTEGLRKLAGRDLPVLMFGHSGGGHFIHRWVYANPSRVRVWCAYGFGWYDEAPDRVKLPPGIIACGLDDERVGATRDAFLSGLRAKAPLCWLGVPHSGHVIDPRAAAFVRDYFEAELSKSTGTPDVWKQADSRGLEGFLVRSRFPNEEIAEKWKQF